MSSTLGVTGSLETKQLRHLHWGRAATGKKSFASMPAGSLRWSPTLRDPVDRGLPGFSVREGVLQARILEPTGQYWLPCLLGHCFLLPQPPAPLRTWCCRNPCDPSSCTASAPGPRGANPSPPGQPQEQTPGDGPHAEVGIKPHVKPRGGVAKEEDPTPPHQLYKLQVKSTRSTRQTLRLWNI